MKSVIRENSFMLISDEYNRFDDKREFKLIHGAFHLNTSEQLPKISKNLAGKPMLSLYFFNEKNNDLIMFEKEITDDLIQNLKDIDQEILEKTDTDFWEHRVFIPRTEEKKDIGISNIDGYDSITKYAYYNTPWGMSTHKITLNLWTGMAKTVYGEGSVTSTAKVSEAYINNPNEPIQYGYSSIYASPVVRYTTFSGESSQRDAIIQQSYNGNWSGKGSTSLSLSVGYGPLNLTIIEKRFNTGISKGHHWNNIPPRRDGGYSVETVMDLSRSYVIDKGNIMMQILYYGVPVQEKNVYYRTGQFIGIFIIK